MPMGKDCGKVEKYICNILLINKYKDLCTIYCKKNLSLKIP